MSRTGWKQVERDAAELLGAKRHWANAGEREDVDSTLFAAQVKNRKRLSLDELTSLVEEMTVRGIDAGKVPAVLVKQSARRPTPLLVVLPADAWRWLWARAIRPALDMLGEGELREAMRSGLREYPGLRKRVEAYVAKSKARA